VFDGRRIELPDASAERIVCFDAFHHASNPETILREFGRVLKPGGIAGFAEPGPGHSRTSTSQFEMRTYGVVENDIDVHAIWRTARTCGFRDIQMIVFHGSPFHVSLEQYEDFLTGGATCATWVESTRGFLRHVRHFLLFKEGSERLDSRQVHGLSCKIHTAQASLTAIEGQPLLIDATVTNRGSAVWLPSDAPHGGVLLGAHLYDEAGTLLNFNAHSEPLTVPGREINAGETVTLRLALAPQRAGHYIVELDCVATRVTWFAQSGSHPATVLIEIVPLSPPRASE
jgi:hypothetical protein